MLSLQPTHHKRKLELEFYTEYFRHADCYGSLDRMFEAAETEALTHGIPVLDALHIAAANLSGCRWLFTSEGPTMPLLRTKLVPVVSIASPLRAT